MEPHGKALQIADYKKPVHFTKAPEEGIKLER